MDGCVRAASHYQAGPRLQLAAAFNPGSMHTARGNSHMHMQHRHRHAHRHAQAVSHGGTSLGRPPAATRAALPAELEGVQIPKHVAVCWAQVIMLESRAARSCVDMSVMGSWRACWHAPWWHVLSHASVAYNHR